MLRESKDNNFKNKLIKKYKKLSPQFIFLYPTLNFRNNEIGATDRFKSTKKLNRNNENRTKNFKLFLSNIDSKKILDKLCF